MSRPGEELRVLSRRELSAALMARQGLLERASGSPSEIIRRLTPLQAQDAHAPYVALHARMSDLTRAALQEEIGAGKAVKSTLMRATLHLSAREDYPAYAQLSRQARLRALGKKYPRLRLVEAEARLGEWLREPRSNLEIRAKVIEAYPEVAGQPWEPILFARTLLPLVQLPPAGYWNSQQHRPLFQRWPEPLPSLLSAAELVVQRYLGSFGPASRADIAQWAGVAQRDLEPALKRVKTVSFQDQAGNELLDLPGLPLPPTSTRLPVRLLARWDQPLLAYRARGRILTPEVERLQLTLSGAQTVLIEGLVAASWRVKPASSKRVSVQITPHREIPAGAREELHAEAERAARLLYPELSSVQLLDV